MEILFSLAIILLVSFVILGLYDGFYLHIFKYRLYEHAESKNEHLTHTIRAMLFPAILYFLFLRQICIVCFWVGLTIVLLDVLTLIIDAYIEKDSRQFMGGLPRWEYIIHLVVNGFHFAGIFIFLAIKLVIEGDDLSLRTDFNNVNTYSSFTFIVKNLIPGGIIMAILHIITLFPKTAAYWNKFRTNFTCCQAPIS